MENCFKCLSMPMPATNSVELTPPVPQVLRLHSHPEKCSPDTSTVEGTSIVSSCILIAASRKGTHFSAWGYMMIGNEGLKWIKALKFRFHQLISQIIFKIWLKMLFSEHLS